MRIDILTLFPGMFVGPFEESIVRRARDAGRLDLQVSNIRDFATDRHRTVDDVPYGGGPGMVMQCGPLFTAVESVRSEQSHVILLTPQGRRLDQARASALSLQAHLVLICGHYEGVDERVRLHLVDEEISIGDYVLTGGEIPAMVLVDAVTRLIPGVLGDPRSALDESHSAGLLEYPQYTRPAEFRGWSVPEILLSGNHRAIAAWRRAEALRRTSQKRPDLLVPEHVQELVRLQLPSSARKKRPRPE